MKNEIRKGGFKIPEDYFENLRNKIPDIIKNDSSHKKINIYYTVAASIILLITSIFIFLPQQNINNNSIILSQGLSDVEYYDINIDDIYYAYEDNDKTSLELNNIDNETIIDYLEEDSDLNELILLSE